MNTLPEKKSSGRGCFLYGCLSVVILLLLAIIVTVLAVRHYVRSTIEQFTDATPRQFETVALTSEENQTLKDRLQTFVRTLQVTNQAASFSLDGAEANALIATEPALAEVGKHLRVQFAGDQLQCLVSLPLDPLAGVPFLGGLKGRYLNATAGVQVSLANGALTTRLVDAQVNGNALPPQALAEIEKNLPWDQWLADPQVKELLGRLDWLKIADGRLQVGTGAPAE